MASSVDSNLTTPCVHFDIAEKICMFGITSISGSAISGDTFFITRSTSFPSTPTCFHIIDLLVFGIMKITEILDSVFKLFIGCIISILPDIKDMIFKIRY